MIRIARGEEADGTETGYQIEGMGPLDEIIPRRGRRRQAEPNP